MSTSVTERQRWQAGLARGKYGHCDECGADRVYVGRVDHGRKWRCFDCSTNPRRRRNAVTTTTVSSGLQRLPLAKLKPSAENRDVGDVDELAASIKAQGILQPIVAVQENGHFLIVAGARRAAAAKKAGLKEVDVLVREFTDTDRLLAMAAENLQREDLTPVEEAELYRHLTEKQGLTQRELAAKVGKSQGHISKRLALLDLPVEVRAQIDSGGIPLADAVEYARLATHPEHLQRAIRNTTEWQPAARQVEKELLTIEIEAKMQAREEELESQAIATVRMSYDTPKGFRLVGGPSHHLDALDTTPAQHAKFSCHTIGIRRNGPSFEEIALCSDPKQHPEIKTRRQKERAAAGTSSTGTPSRPNQNAKLDRVREQLREAAQSRTAFITQLVSGKALSKGQLIDLVVDGYIAEAIDYGESNVDFAAIALDLVETDDEGAAIWPDGVRASVVLGAYAIKGDIQRLRLAAALRLGWAEESDFATWNYDTHWSAAAKTHLEFLAQHGYELTPLEKQRMPNPERAAA